MTDKITSGPYVIRNRHTSTVLHIEDSTFHSNYSKLVAFEQDENQYRDKQVWWVEPLPDPEDGEGVVYSITNTSCRKSLDQAMDGHICAATLHGAPWQAWRIQNVGNDDEGACYTIIAPRTGQVITAPEPSVTITVPRIGRAAAASEPNITCQTQIYVPGNSLHTWEFVIPIVSFPVGWFQIQNVGTGDLISHKYPCNPPVLLPPPTTGQPSQHLESWGTQWTLANTKSISPNFKCTTGKNTWYIMNRLTRGFLANSPGTSEDRKVVAWEMGWLDCAELVWKLELDPACNWTIMHHRTSLLLEQTDVPRGGGTEAACIDKRFNVGTRRRSWVLKAPVLETSDEVRAYFRSLGVDASAQLLVSRRLTKETSTKTAGSPGL